MLQRQNGELVEAKSPFFFSKSRKMKILLAESKLMAPERPVDEKTYRARTPRLEEFADDLMDSLRQLSVPELAERLGLSPSLARRMYECVYNFGNKHLGVSAIEAFDGVAFRNFSFATLPAVARRDARRRIGIISSLYGLLRADDIIKPYRLNFSSAPRHKSMKRVLKPLVTPLLTDDLRKEPGGVLLLLPADAQACFDVRVLTAAGIRVTTARILQLRDGGRLATPPATRLKEARGLLAREIILRGIDHPDLLNTFESPTLVADPQQCTPDTKLLLIP